MVKAMEPVHLAGSVLNRSYHVCAFFHSKDEEYRVLMPFIKEGFARGDRSFHVLQENPFYVPPDEMLKELAERKADRNG